MATKKIQSRKNGDTKRKFRKHFIIFNNGGVLSATTPKDWARAHRELFPNYNFIGAGNTPIVDVIENYLVNNEGFSSIENDEIVIHYIYLNI